MITKVIVAKKIKTNGQGGPLCMPPNTPVITMVSNKNPRNQAAAMRMTKKRLVITALPVFGVCRGE